MINIAIYALATVGGITIFMLGGCAAANAVLTRAEVRELPGNRRRQPNERTSPTGGSVGSRLSDSQKEGGEYVVPLGRGAFRSIRLPTIQGDPWYPGIYRCACGDGDPRTLLYWFLAWNGQEWLYADLETVVEHELVQSWDYVRVKPRVATPATDE